MKEQILKLRLEGKTYKQIKEEVGCSSSTVSYHCGKGQKEKFSQRTEKNRKNICECGNLKRKVAPKCRECYNKEHSSNHLDKTRLHFTSKMKNNHKYLKVRKHAQMVMKKSTKIKECKICGFNHYVEVCHIKPIASFEDSSLLGEINHIDNLVYLCPNHHILLDKGIISL